MLGNSVGDFLTDNHIYELCNDKTSSPNYQNYPILFHDIEPTNYVDPLVYAKKH